MNVTIREATEFDTTPMLGLWHELMDYHQEFEPLFERREDAPKAWLKFVRENMDKDNALVLAAEWNDNLVGYCQALVTAYPPVFKREYFGELMDMVVTPDQRHQGVGTRLFATVKQWYQQQGIDRIEVRAHVHNPISIPFWEGLGFQPYLTTFAMEI